MLKTEFISIVGTSRSGTTLMRKILNKSDEISIAFENHFLGHIVTWEGAIYKFRKLGDLTDDRNVHKLIRYIYSGGFQKDSKYRGISRHWEWLIDKVDSNNLLQRILSSDRTERGLFVAVLQAFADYNSKPIIGEKTPAHVRHVPTLLEWFPKGKIIHMLRDPRAVFVSEHRRRNALPITTPYKQLAKHRFLFKLFIVLQTTIFWYESTWRCFRNRRLWPNNYYVLRFEDLVAFPQKYVRQVCDFLGIVFHNGLLNQKVISNGFRVGQDGFDAQAAIRWKKYIEPWINSWFLFWFKKYLRKCGYI